MRINKNTVIYPITIEDLQNDAIKLKCVECGLSSIVDITLKSAIEAAVESNRKLN